MKSSNRCPPCKTYRDNVLCGILNRVLKQSDNERDVTETSSHANFCYLNTEKIGHLKNLYTAKKNSSKIYVTDWPKLQKLMELE